MEALFFVWNSWVLAAFSLFLMIVELFWGVYAQRIFLVLTVGSDAGCGPLFLIVKSHVIFIGSITIVICQFYTRNIKRFLTVATETQISIKCSSTEIKTPIQEKGATNSMIGPHGTWNQQFYGAHSQLGLAAIELIIEQLFIYFKQVEISRDQDNFQ